MIEGAEVQRAEQALKDALREQTELAMVAAQRVVDAQERLVMARAEEA